MYWIYYQPDAVPEGRTGDTVVKLATIEEAFIESVRLKSAGYRDVRILKEIEVKVEVA